MSFLSRREVRSAPAGQSSLLFNFDLQIETTAACVWKWTSHYSNSVVHCPLCTISHDQTTSCSIKSHTDLLLPMLDLWHHILFWSFNVNLSAHTHTHTQWVICYYGVTTATSLGSRIRFAPVHVAPSLPQYLSLSGPRRQLQSPFIFSLTDRKWAAGRHLTPRPRWLSEGHRVAQSIIVFTLFPRYLEDEVRSVADLLDFWKGYEATPEQEEKVWKGEFMWKAMCCSFLVLRHHRHVTALINAN